jgi:hypothetical protein
LNIKKTLQGPESPVKDTGRHAWAKKLMQQIWGHFHAVWKLRCDERNKLDADTVSKQHTQRVNPEMPIAIRSHHCFTTKTIDAQLNCCKKANPSLHKMPQQSQTSAPASTPFNLAITQPEVKTPCNPSANSRWWHAVVLSMI